MRSDGTPASNASIGLVPANEPMEPAGSSFLAPSSMTDRRGRFAIDAILPGRYLLAVNARSGPHPSAPYLSTYLVAPGGKPRVIEVGEGKRRAGFTLVVEPLAETRVAGRVVFADGRPAAEANVVAFPIEHRSSVAGSAKTNSTGDFELRVFDGLRYVVKAGTSTSAGYRKTESLISVDGPQDGVRLLIQP